VRHAIEGAIEHALKAGTFVRYRSMVEFVRGLQAVADRLAELVGAGDPDLAADLYQTFIAACQEKAEEIDDSGGDLGRFAQDLFVGWVRARQAAKADCGETVRSLGAWMDDDPYGYCYEIEREVTKVMDPPHLAAFARLARERLDQAPADDGGSAGFPRRRWTEVLRHTLAVQGDARAYLELCQASRLRADDCHVLARIHDSRGESETALDWVRRGLALARQDRFRSGVVSDLEEQQLSLLRRLGRQDEAMAVAWAEFQEGPSRFRYETLLENVPAGERAAWHERAMMTAEGGEAAAAIELFVETGERLRLARRVTSLSDAELESLSHYVLEPAARALRASNPALAARLHRALAKRILTARSSRHYPIALRHLERARSAYEASGQENVWNELIRDLRETHRRKSSLMPGLERLAAGLPAREPRPSLVERAKRRWPR
jgi:hypothetical protein